MKIAFVAKSYENLAVEALSACLKERGYEVLLVFDPALFKSQFCRIVWLEKVFDYTASVVRDIVVAMPDAVCFSVLSDDVEWALLIARQIKKERPAIKIIFGGIHSTCVPEVMIKENCIDYVCVGEGEHALVALIEALAQKKENIRIRHMWYKHDGNIQEGDMGSLCENLDCFPFADKELYYKPYPIFKKHAYKIITSRGCPHGCSYCYNNILRKIYAGKGQYLRRRSVDHVMRELLHARQVYSIRDVRFLDDTFTYDLEWLRQFLKRYRTEIALPFGCTVHPRYASKEVVRLLSESGCVLVNMGVQDLNPDIKRNILFRSETNREVEKALRLFKRTRIFVYTTIILGIPFQSEQDRENILLFFNKVRPNVPDSNWLRYYPKTAITEYAREKGILDESEHFSIVQGEKYEPYGLGGHTKTKELLQFRNFLYCLMLVPRRIGTFVISQKWYRYMPAFEMRPFILLLIFVIAKMKGYKNVYPIWSIQDIVYYHMYFCCKVLKLRKYDKKKRID